MKRSKILAMTLAVLCVSAGASFASQYSDVTKDYWAYKPIKKMTKKHILAGYEDKTFRPQASVTRAEFATMVSKAIKQSNKDYENIVSFNDVELDFWAYDDICKLGSLGLIAGFPDNTYKPEAPISIEEAYTIISKALETEELTTEEVEEVLSQFSDKEEIADWAVGPVSLAIKDKLYINDEDTLNPTTPVSRAEVAVLLYKLRKNHNLLAQFD